MANPSTQFSEIIDNSNQKRMQEILNKFEDAGLTDDLKEFMFIKSFPFKAFDERRLNG